VGSSVGAAVGSCVRKAHYQDKALRAESPFKTIGACLSDCDPRRSVVWRWLTSVGVGVGRAVGYAVGLEVGYCREAQQRRSVSFSRTQGALEQNPSCRVDWGMA
jgi:hypothetical protein